MCKSISSSNPLKMKLYPILLFLFFNTLFLKSFSSKNSKYDACSGTFKCGNLDDGLRYPFYDGSTRPEYCGYPGFKLDCSQGIPHPHITISDQEYNLIKAGDAVDSHIITVSRNDTWTNSCPDRLTNTAIDLSKFSLSSTNQNITFFYACEGSTVDLSHLALNTSTCNLGGYGSLDGYYLTQEVVDQHKILFQNCKFNIFLPVSEAGVEAVDGNLGNLGNLITAFEAGFDLDLITNDAACSSCIGSNGVCGWDSKKFVCHCDDADYNLKCGVGSPLDQGTATTSKNKGSKHKTSIAIGVSIGAVALLSLLGGCLLILQKCKRDPQNRSMEDSLKNYASIVPKRYTYRSIKKMSNSFREKLGEGGYGTVFKGSLHDGRVVAVKVWKQSKGDGQDFINEVMSISRTSHVNVVPLLGFCFEGHKRALIYEFMPNGSLEKFIQGRYFNKNNQPLSAKKLFEIGVGIARGLEYLHRGCNTRIVHFDIKPHNILLDAEFTPKISDFGLAKSCLQKESIISMSGARGTIGYIAPEVFFRTYGGVSHKSDVYSFGMMVLEMVGCKNRVNDNSENSSEMYFPQWIYKQLEQEMSIVDCERILNEDEKKLERKMIVVGLWCIQINPSSRPSMNRVVEMLEGKVELLEVPPMPTLASLPRQEQPTDDNSTDFLSSSTTYAPAMNC